MSTRVPDFLAISVRVCMDEVCMDRQCVFMISVYGWVVCMDEVCVWRREEGMS